VRLWLLLAYLAVAYDLKVFFEVVGRAPKRVRPSDVLGFMTAQRTGQTSLSQRLQPVEDGARGVSSRTVRRRLSSVSGRFASSMSVAILDEPGPEGPPDATGTTAASSRRPAGQGQSPGRCHGS